MSPSRATLQAADFGRAGGGAHPGGHAVLDLRVLPVADDHLSPLLHPRADEAELAVAVGGLVQVHEVHVDRRPRQVAIELRVQVQKRLLQGGQPGDPHLGGREGVHPEHQARAVGGGVGLAADVEDGLRRGDHRLADDAHRQPPGGVEPGDDLPAVFGDLAEGRFAVKVLAAGDEPNFQLFEIHFRVRNKTST